MTGAGVTAAVVIGQYSFRAQAEKLRVERKERERKTKEIMRELQGQESTYKKRKMIGKK